MHLRLCTVIMPTVCNDYTMYNAHPYFSLKYLFGQKCVHYTQQNTGNFYKTYWNSISNAEVVYSLSFTNVQNVRHWECKMKKTTSTVDKTVKNGRLRTSTEEKQVDGTT